MKSVLLFIGGLVVGAVLAFFLASGFAAGVGAGAGIVTGLKAGACLTAEAAREQGLITAEQVDDLLQAAGRQISSSAVAAGDAPLVSGGDAECRKVIADLKAAAQD